MAQVSVIVLTALLTSVLTLVGAWAAFDRHLKVRMRAEIDEKVEELGLLIRKRTSEGVREGIADSLAEMRKKATKSATQAPLDILEESLSMWFGNRRTPD